MVTKKSQETPRVREVVRDFDDASVRGVVIDRFLSLIREESCLSCGAVLRREAYLGPNADPRTRERYCDLDCYVDYCAE